MKKVCSFLISCFPINGLRIFWYRILCGYDIDYKSRVGIFNIISVKEFKMERAEIGNFNYIDAYKLEMGNGALINKLNKLKHLNVISMGERSIIFSRNFLGGSRQSINFPKQNLKIGNDTEILRNNYFDVTDEIIIGNNVVFGGNGSEVWTHGFDTKRNILTGKVIFQNDIFIGSNCIFTKGITVVGNTTIGPGSVIYKSIEESGLYSSQQLVKVK